MERSNTLKNIIACSVIALGPLISGGCAGSSDKALQKSSAEQAGMALAEYGYVLRYNFEGKARELFREGLYWEARSQGKDITGLTEQYRGDITASIDKNNDYKVSETEARNFRDASKANAIKVLNLENKTASSGSTIDN